MPAEFEKGAKVERWERNLANPAAALKQVGVLMVAESQQAFRDQKLGADVWEPRRPINVPGIIADFAAGKKAPAARRFETRPALKDTGRLAASIAFKVTGTQVVEVGSNLPYAGVHQHGGESETLPITQDVRKLMAAWLRGPGRKYRTQLGWLLNKKFAGTKLKTKIRKRPIVGITKQTLEDVQEVVGVKIMEAR